MVFKKPISLKLISRWKQPVLVYKYKVFVLQAYVQHFYTRQWWAICLTRPKQLFMYTVVKHLQIYQQQSEMTGRLFSCPRSWEFSKSRYISSLPCTQIQQTWMRQSKSQLDDSSRVMSIFCGENSCFLLLN